MCQLTKHTAAEYGRLIGLADRSTKVAVYQLTGGVSNVVIMVDSPSGCFVLKQPDAFLRVGERWEVDRARIWHEVAATKLWVGILGARWARRVLHEERENYIYAMSCAPVGASNWKQQLLRGVIEPATARQAGRAVGEIHRRTSADEGLARAFRHDEVFVQGRVDPYFGPIIASGGPLAEPLEELCEKLLERKPALIHGDLSPKNILVASDHVFVLDFEFCHFGDPAFLLNHFVLKAIHRCRDRGHFFALAREFWESYRRSFGDLAPVDIESTTVFIWGGLLIARVDGKSPAEYIRDDASRQAIRKLSAHILCENIASVEQSLEKEDNVIAWLESRYLP